jgi:hypothetical protein
MYRHLWASRTHFTQEEKGNELDFLSNAGKVPEPEGSQGGNVAGGQWHVPEALLVCTLLGVSTSARAFEINSGASVGMIRASVVPRLTVTPHAGISWSRSSGLMFASHEMISILPPIHQDGAGVYEQTSLVIGYAGETRNFSVGPSFSIYDMPACGTKLCGRVVGLAPGGHAQVNVYFYGRLGVSVNASIDWVGGRSLVLPGSVAAMIVAGPVLRWKQE